MDLLQNELKMTDLIDVKPDLLENDDPPFLGFPSDVPKRKTLQTFYQNYCQHDKCNKVLESKQCFIRLERLSENHMANDSKKCCTLEQVTTFSQGLEVSLNKINSKINCEVFPEPKQCFVSIRRLSQHFLENESWKCSAISQNFSVNPKFISRIPHQRNFCCEDDKSTVKVTIKEKPNKCSLNQKYPARIQRVSHQQMFGSKDVTNTIEIIGVEKTNVGLANDNQCCYNDCKKTLSLKQNLVGHTDAVHIKLKPFKCWECEKYFSFKSVLRKHVQSAHENLKPYECCECKKYFAYKCSLITHIKSVHEKLKPFKYFKFETQANFDLRNNDLQPKPNAGSESNSGFCKVWNAGLQNKREKTHSSCVTEPKNNRTSDYVHSLVAETSFFRPSKISFSKLKYKRDRKIIPKNILSENVHKKVRRSLNSYQCNKCDSEFGSMKNFTKHVQSVHPGFKNFKCSECSWAFSERYNLYRHIRSVHRNLRPFSCSHCGRAFSDKSILALHIEAVHFKLKPFDCPECNVAFRSKAHLTRHINVVHRKLKPFTCDICGYAASCHPVIIRHINAVHLGLKLHKCDECDASFDCKSNLIRHVKCIHRNLRPFKCHKCSYAARCKGSLIGHMSYVHETARLFKCRECDKAFKGRTSLSSHSRIHAKCKPFKCNDCEISFAAKFILARHIKTTHSI